MKAFDTFGHFEPNGWINNRSWLISRALFLITMKEKNNERFHGGDGETLEDIQKNQKESFYLEYLALSEKYPALFNIAFGIWLNDDNEKISYVEMK